MYFTNTNVSGIAILQCETVIVSDMSAVNNISNVLLYGFLKFVREL